MRNYYEVLQNLLDETIEDSNYKVREIISEEFIHAIECNIEIFNDIPSEDIKTVFEDLLTLVHKYELKAFNKDTENMIIGYGIVCDAVKNKKYENEESSEKLISSIRAKKKKPIIKIKQDLKVLKDYQKTICKLFGIKILDKKKVMFVSTPENIITIFEDNQKLINDLEAKEFKIISKYNYYDANKTSKSEIISFFNNLKDKYNLRNITYDINELIACM